MSIVTDKRTENLGLPLPAIENDMADDCPHIAESLQKLDAAHGENVLKTAATREIAETALLQAQTAQGVAHDTAGITETALAKASEAETVANEAKLGLDDKLSLSSGTRTGELTFSFPNVDLSKDPETYRNLGCIRLQDSAGIAQSMFYGFYNTDGESCTIMTARSISVDGQQQSAYAWLSCNRAGKNSFVLGDPNISPYCNDVPHIRWCMTTHPIKISGSKNFYVGRENASDTAGLFMGRGKSANMPFATLQACLNYISCNLSLCGFSVITIILQSDQNITGIWWLPKLNGYQIDITSDSTRRKITVSSYCNFSSSINFYNVIIDALYVQVSGLRTGTVVRFLGNVEIIGRGAPGNHPALFVSALAQIYINDEKMAGGFKITSANGNTYLGAYANGYMGVGTSNLTLSGISDETGKVRGVYVVAGGVVAFRPAPAAIEGDANPKGKRYFASQGGKILVQGKGPDFIPGSIAGTCDEYSVYC